MNNNGVNPQNTSTAARLARAAQRYAFRANNGGTMGGLGAAAMRKAAESSGGTETTPKRRFEAAVSRGAQRLSPEAAREILNERQGKLGDVMAAALKKQAGPVK